MAIDVSATVSASCGFSIPPSGGHNVGDLAAAFSHDFPFTVSCNGPFRVAVVSANGALRAPGSPPTGYTASAPYDVRLNLVADRDGGAVAACSAASLRPEASNSCAFRGPANGAQGLLVSGASTSLDGAFLRVQSAGYRGPDLLIASNAYQDVLTVTISAAP